MPIIGLKVVFLFFFVVGPVVLLAMQVYLQIQACALLHISGTENANGLLHNHAQWWPMSLLGFASYGVVPLVTTLLLWQIWLRRFIDDSLLFGDVRINPRDRDRRGLSGRLVHPVVAQRDPGFSLPAHQARR